MEYFYFLKEAIDSGKSLPEESASLSDFFDDPYLDVEKYITRYEKDSRIASLRLSYSKYSSLN